jgi:hypothetical protein
MADGRTGMGETLDALVRETTTALGLARPLDPLVLRAASGDPDYARSLAESRGDPARLRELVENPPPMPDATEEVSDLDLALHGARALWGWLRGGLATVPEGERARRLAVCRRCPNVRELPARWLYELAAAGVSEGIMCGLCGCVLDRKAWLPGSACPAEDPDRPGFDRWGHVMKKEREE